MIYCSGSIAYDRIMNFPGRFSDHILPNKIHQISVSFYLEKFNESFGGTAGNIAYNLALLGEKVEVVGLAGNDFSKYQKWLRQNKIGTRFIKIIKTEPTAAAYMMTDQNDNQISGFYPGAMKQVGYYKNVKLPKAKLACVAADSPQAAYALARYYKKNNTPYIFDPGQIIIVLTKQQLLDGLNGCDVFISNDYELALILKRTGLSKSQLKKKVPIVVTTLGAKGSIIEDNKNNQRYKIPAAKPKNTSDPTGAGDAYRAGLIKGMMENYSWPKVGRLASTVAVYAVEKYGTQTHTFTWSQLKARYKKNFGTTL
ncbi:MAG: carbohydrate kinase family protein [Candidatus Buchananbacteria bacterium CG10_big_fil_rev_8_21_14_0_10_42_9]|uniref:Carbohydrate kinase family protein n=1 Tax=Candidatus Buchananbacteria bacterium CG10_big_fil_rev_8_21_14_0_10_42_9 TaxID=1974526 RepID=A0A2H0W499_9BACT|nr:MAG: carbohydrate kinase family protein [Candidatus Buchananbacteria bacterium CG10_big_fil_rev_8_21_14_0_10_42_9]